MRSLDLAIRTTGSSINCVHPATYMPTKMVLHSDAVPVDDLAKGVDAVVFQATAAEHAGATGLYFDGRALARAHSQAYDERDAATCGRGPSSS